MCEYIKRQDAIDVVGKQYRYESDRMTALQELPVIQIKCEETNETNKVEAGTQTSKEKWSEYQECIQDKKFSIEEQLGDLCMYYYFDTLQWGYRYAIVLKDTIILISEEYPYDEWFGASEAYKIITNK